MTGRSQASPATAADEASRSRAVRRAAVPSWLAVALALLAAAAPTRGAAAPTDTLTLDVGVVRDDRYALEVSFPSPSGARVIVDGSVHPALGNLDPRAIPGRTLTIHRDGRVEWPAVAAPGIPLVGITNPSPPLVDSPGSGGLLRPVFQPIGPGFQPSYYWGTVIPAWGDYDNDGDEDLPLFRNDGGTFNEIPGFRMHLQNGNYHGSAWGDLDKDGDLDLVLAAYYVPGLTQPTRTRLLRNDGHGIFTDIAPAQGIDFQSRGETALWGDFNLDGWPDLFVPYYDHIPPYVTNVFMYFNDGQGNLVDSTAASGLGLQNAYLEGADMADWEGDGDLDIYFASRLFLNDGRGHFTDVSAEVGLPQSFDEGGAFVDADSDGDFDLYIRRAEGATLYRNDAGHLTDVTVEAGLPPTGLYWGDAWADADNDGDQDLIYHFRGDSARLMLNDGRGRFVEEPSFRELADWRGMAAWADVDRDGDLDFVDGAPSETLFVNRLDEQVGFDDTWLRVRVLDAQGLKTEQGATVRLRPLTGPVGRVQTRAVGGGGSYLSHNEYTTHFGLGLPGTVTRTPDQAAYAPGTEVTLEAVPAAGYRFAEWTGDASGSTNPLTVTLDASIRVEARFEVASYHTLTAGTTGGGTIAQSPELATYPIGSRVTLTATPLTGWSFVGWSGDVNGSANPIHVDMDGDREVTAQFAISTYTMSVATTGSGSVAKSPNRASYVHGEQVQLTATPAPGHHFTGWSGDLTGTQNPATLVMDENKSVTASFTVNTYTLQLSVLGEGSATRNPDQALYAHGSQVQLAATPSPGYGFSGWKGALSGDENPATLDMTANAVVTARFDPLAGRVWVGTTGGGDGVSWSDRDNWSGGVLPGPGDDVRLDNSRIPGDYAVELPNGQSTIGITRLTIAPDSGRSITLTIPENNRALPALLVGDDAPGTLDLELGAGAVLRNASGSSSGNTLQLRGAGNASAVIRDGARYVHATRSSAVALVTSLVGEPGSDAGVFEYDVPGTSLYPIVGVEANYGALTLRRSSGPATYSLGGMGTLRVRGALTLETGVAVSSAMSGELRLGGDVIDRGVGLLIPSTQHVVFTGPGLQRITGPAGLTIGGTSEIAAGATLGVGAAPFAMNAMMTVAGTLRLEGNQPPGGTGGIQYAPGSELVFAQPSGAFPVIGNQPWPAVVGPARVRVLAPDGIQLLVSRTVQETLVVRGPIERSDRLTLNGTALLGPGGSFVQPPRYGGNATLVYEAPRAVGAEWTAGTAVGNGVPANVVVATASGAVTLPPEPRAVPNDLVVASGELRVDPAWTEIDVGGDVVVDGALTLLGGSLQMNGAGLQTLGGAGFLDPGTLRLAKAGGAVRLARDLALIPATGPALDLGGTVARLELNGHRLLVGAPIAGSHADGALAGDPLARLALQGQGDAGIVGFAAGAGRLASLDVALEQGRIALASPLTVDTLRLARGWIAAPETLTVAASGAVVRGDGWVEGALRRFVDPGATTVAFDVGYATARAAVEVAFDAVLAPGAVVAGTTSGDHPALGASTLDAARTVNRTWTLRAEEIAFTTCRAIFEVPPGDLDSSAAWSRLVVRRHDAGVWSWLATGARSEGSVEALGIGGLGDFAIGDVATWALSAAAVGHGTVTVEPARSEFDDGEAVALTAMPEPGHAFVGWADDLSDAATFTLVMHRDQAVVARFTQALEVGVMGGGVVSGAPAAGLQPHGATVTLTAVADPGHHFAGWSGDATGTENPLALLMDQDRVVNATFERDSFVVTTGINGPGTLAGVPDGRLAVGAVVTLTAEPAPGYHFAWWTGDTMSAANPLAIVVDRDRELIACFRIDHHLLGVQPDSGGTVTQAPMLGTYEDGTEVTLTAVPLPGRRFVAWGGDTAATTNPLVLTMTRDRALTASFVDVPCTLTVVTSGPGTVARLPLGPIHPYGTRVTLIAQPHPGYGFEGWGGHASGTDSSVVVTMHGSRLVTASFADFEPPAVTLLAPNGGESLVLGATVELRWTATDAVGVLGVDLHVSRNGPDGPFELLAMNQPNDGSYSWVVHGAPSNDAYVMVTARDVGGNESLDLSDAPFRTGNFIASADAARITEFALAPPAPNPMRDRVLLHYDLPYAAPIHLAICDVQGREVAVLASGAHAPGRYRAVWSTGDGRVPSGIYFVRFRRPGKEHVRRLVVTQ